jgi:NAD(P)-dependent dehydrogenase (short-subunit alcohol dehydrogenase family)
VTGTVGLVAALFPRAWLGLFTADERVLATGATYLHVVGPTFGSFGLGLALYFAAQGAGRMGWALAAGAGRVAVGAGGGWVAVAWLGLGIEWLFAAVALAFVGFGLAQGLAVGRMTHWIGGPKMTKAKPVALVTGASSGIGRATALALVEAGFDVVGTSRNASGVTQRDGVTFLELDVTSDESVTTAVRSVIERFGRIDVLVNNAGTGAAGAAEESSVVQAQRVFDINFFGVIRMTRAVLPHMRAQGSGRIVNISSVLGLIPAPYMAVYAATKHAIEGYSESVDHEVREHGVRVLLVEPAYTRTGFDANAVQADAPVPVYAERRRLFDRAVASAMERGDDPATVARSIVAAATDPKPKLRYAAGPTARRVSALRRFVPAWAFDRQIRKLNRLPA